MSEEKTGTEIGSWLNAVMAPMVVVDETATVLGFNQAAVDYLKPFKRVLELGRPFSDYTALNRPALMKALDAALSGETQTLTVQTMTAQGQPLLLKMHFAAFEQQKQKLAAVSLVEDHSLEMEQLHKYVKPIQDHRQSRMLQTLQSMLSSQVAESLNISAQNTLVSDAAQCLQVHIASLWRNTPDNILERIYLYDAEPEHEAPPLFLNLNEFPAYREALMACKVIAAQKIDQNPITLDLTRICHKYGVNALLDVPIVDDGVVMGVLCFEFRGEEREWTKDEEMFAWSVGQAICQRWITHKLKNVLSDLAARKRKLNEIQASTEYERALLSTILDSSRDSIVALDDKLRVQYLNKGSYELHRFYNISMNLGDFYPDTLDQKVRGQVVALWERALNGEVIHQQLEYVPEGGEPHYYEINMKPLYNSLGYVVGAVNYRRDLTEHLGLLRRLEHQHFQLEAQHEELQQSLEELQATQEHLLRLRASDAEQRSFIEAVLNSTEDAVFALDEGFKLNLWNTGFYELTQLLNIPIEFGTILEPEQLPRHGPQVDKILWAAMLGKAQRLEIDVPLPDGTHYFLMAVNPIIQENSIKGLVCVARDITALKKVQFEIQEKNEALAAQSEELRSNLEQLELLNENLKQTQSQLVQSERMASVGQLTAGLVHEINNPLNFIIGGVDAVHEQLNELLEMQTRLQKLLTLDSIAEIQKAVEKLKVQQFEVSFENCRHTLLELLATIRLGSDRMYEVVRSLRTFARAEEVELREVDLHSLLDNTLVLLSSLYKNRIQVVRHFAPNLPALSCYQGLMNQLLMNLLSNAIQAIPQEGNIWLRTDTNPQGEVVLEIQDDGVGMPPHVVSRIFEPFFTTKPIGQGTGLGLSITYGIVQRHNGRIEVESKPGKGTTFRVHIPSNLKPGPQALKL